MIKDVVKDAFDEGRQVGGEWEDSDAKIVSELLPLMDIRNVRIRQRHLNGQYGQTFDNIDGVRDYVSTVLRQDFHSSNFIASLLNGWKSHGFSWEVA